MAPSLRSPFLLLLSMYLLCVLFAWFVVEVIIHAHPQPTANDDFQLQLTLAEQTLQLFMYTCLLTVFILAGCWFAELERTKAARSVSLVTSTLAKSAWLYELWFVISVYDDASSPLNWYCTGGPYFAGLTSSSSIWCNLAQAVGSLSIAMFVGFIALWVWAICVLFKRITPDVPVPTTHLLLPAHRSGVTNASNSAHSMDISWRIVLTHPEDLEQATIASAYPHLFGPSRARVRLLGTLCSIPMFFVTMGGLLFTYPSIAFSHSTGLQAWTTSAGAGNNTTSYNGWGDPIVAEVWYYLVGTLGVTMVINAYANGRSNRSWSAAAAVASYISAAFFWSFFIYSARRLHADYGNLVSMSLLNDANAQYAEIAGAGMIMLSVTALAILFTIRYFLYLHITPEQHRAIHTAAHLDGPTEVRVEKDEVSRAGPSAETLHVPGPAYDPNVVDQVPSYIRPVLSGVSLPLRCLLALEAIILVAWWVMMLVQECESDLFTLSQADAAYFYNEKTFMLCTVVAAVSFGAAIFAERHVSRPTAVAAWATSALMLAAFFILVWPWAYQSVYSGGDLYVAICGTGSSLCKLTQANGVFAMVQGFMLLFLFLHTWPRLVYSWRVVPALTNAGYPGHLSIPSALTGVMLLVVWVWAFATIALTIHSDGFAQQNQHVDTPDQNEGTRFTEGYWASQAFLLLACITLSVWLACSSPGRSYSWQSPAWRALTVGSFAVTFAVTVPMLILACRFAHDLSGLSGAERTLIAVFIILPFVALFALIAEAALSQEPFYHPSAAQEQHAHSHTRVEQHTVMVKPPLPPRPGQSSVTVVEMGQKVLYPISSVQQAHNVPPQVPHV